MTANRPAHKVDMTMEEVRVTEPEIFYREQGALIVARIGYACVAIWRHDSNMMRVGRQREGLLKVVQRNPGKAVFMCVVEPSSAPPDESARKASSRMVEEHGDALRGVAVVIEGAGFRASIVRSVASGIVLLARSKSKTPVSYFSGVVEGAEWLRKYVDLGSPGGFTAALESLREGLGNR